MSQQTLTNMNLSISTYICVFIIFLDSNTQSHKNCSMLYNLETIIKITLSIIYMS